MPLSISFPNPDPSPLRNQIQRIFIVPSLNGVKYPKRGGGNSKKAAFTAWKARINDDVEPNELLAGVERYAKFCTAEHLIGTKFVKHGGTFFGPDEHWKESWESSGTTNGAGSHSESQRPFKNLRFESFKAMHSDLSPEELQKAWREECHNRAEADRRSREEARV